MMALDAGVRGLVSVSAESPDVSGVVVDVPRSGGFASIVALADGTTSMYTSTGGGVIGAGTHAHVAEATRRLLAEVQRHLELFGAPDDRALPAPSLVRLHVVTPTGGRHADVPEGAFWGRLKHPLIPVIARVQDVISAISTATPPGA
jgi:L-alanine-DL-glutamate epimerase-like enolase superfamily enzyme